MAEARSETRQLSDRCPYTTSQMLVMMGCLQQYQEEKDGTLVPVDHVDRALSITEQGWESQLLWESLGNADKGLKS